MNHTTKRQSVDKELGESVFSLLERRLVASIPELDVIFASGGFTVDGLCCNTGIFHLRKCGDKVNNRLIQKSGGVKIHNIVFTDTDRTFCVLCSECQSQEQSDLTHMLVTKPL